MAAHLSDPPQPAFTAAELAFFSQAAALEGSLMLNGEPTGSLADELAIAQRRIAYLEADRDRYLNQIVALEARCQDVAAMQADVVEVLTHEVSFKLGVTIEPSRARDIAAQLVTVIAARLDPETVYADAADTATKEAA